MQGDAGDERQWYGAVEPLDISSLEPPQRQMLVAFLQGLADILDAGSIVVARESGGRQLAGEPESPFNCFADNILSIFNRSNLACMTHAELRSALNALLILLYKYEPEFAALLDRRSSDKRDRAETTRSLLKTCARELLNFFATNAECSEDNKLVRAAASSFAISNYANFACFYRRLSPCSPPSLSSPRLRCRCSRSSSACLAS